ncbi:MAG: hypothetical protein ACKVQC_01130 [Elusimicrobiota bacterium]
MNLGNQSKWKITLDASYMAQYSFMNKKIWKEVKEDKWRYYEIQGRYGVIYPYSESHLAVYFTSLRVFRDYSHQGKWMLIRQGDWEGVYIVPNDCLDEAAEAIKAYRKRHISTEHLKKLATGRERLKSNHFSPSDDEFIIPKIEENLPMIQGDQENQNKA